MVTRQERSDIVIIANIIFISKECVSVVLAWYFLPYLLPSINCSYQLLELVNCITPLHLAGI